LPALQYLSGLRADLRHGGGDGMVHVGYAIQTMTEQEARSTWEMLAAEGNDA
jgi:hydrogenase maturation factor